MLLLFLKRVRNKTQINANEAHNKPDTQWWHRPLKSDGYSHEMEGNASELEQFPTTMGNTESAELEGELGLVRVTPET